MYKYSLMDYYLEDAYNVALTSNWWKEKETVYTVDGGAIVRLKGTKYTANFGYGPPVYYPPDKLETIISNIINKYSKTYGIKISIEKTTTKRCTAINGKRFCWNVLHYDIVTDKPLSYILLNKIKTEIMNSGTIPQNYTIVSNKLKNIKIKQMMHKQQITTQPRTTKPITIQNQRNNPVFFTKSIMVPRTIKPIVFNTRKTIKVLH